jgi:hypothetical protein
VHGWETLLAAVGGLLVGLGLGVTIGRRGDARQRTERVRVEAAVRTSVVPVLEARAEELGVSRAPDVTDPVASAITLADAIRRHESRGLPYSDTVAVDKQKLSDPPPSESIA